MKVINWDSNTVIRIQLWDIAGEFVFITNHTELYNICVRICCLQPNCPACVIVYHICCSFIGIRLINSSIA